MTKDILESLQVGSELREKDDHTSLRYVLELPDTVAHWHLTGEADFCMCESWYEEEEMLERFEPTGKVLAIKDIPKDDRTCSGCEDSGPMSYTFGTVSVEREDLKEVLDILLDVAEDCYEGYSGSDNIAKVLDFYKENIDGEREPLTCSHYQCNGERIESTDACKNHQFCTCEKVQGKHYTINH